MNHWHLYSDFENGKNTGGMIEYVRLFSIIAYNYFAYCLYQLYESLNSKK